MISGVWCNSPVRYVFSIFWNFCLVLQLPKKIRETFFSLNQKFRKTKMCYFYQILKLCTLNQTPLFILFFDSSCMYIWDHLGFLFKTKFCPNCLISKVNTNLLFYKLVFHFHQQRYEHLVNKER